MEEDLFLFTPQTNQTALLENETALLENETHGNNSNATLYPSFVLPSEFTEMSSSSIVCVIVYIILFCIATTGNLTVFITVYKQYLRVKSRISLLILHLAVTDLIVSVCLIPIEIFWRIFIQWFGGSLLCKLCQFFRAFGLYLSSMVLICISFDRFFAIVYPFRVMEGMHRVKVMLWAAWLASFIFAAPQTIIFDVVSHPQYYQFRQCVTKSFLSHPEDYSRLYSIFSVSIMYFAPLIVIIFTYTMILCKIVRKSREQKGGGAPSVMTRNSDPPLNNISTHLRAASFKGMLNLKRSNTMRSSSNSSALATMSPCSETAVSTPVQSCNSDSMERNGKENTTPVSKYAPHQPMVLRRSENAASNINRAKGKTLRLTVIIVCVFVFCWTPYVVMTLW